MKLKSISIPPIELRLNDLQKSRQMGHVTVHVASQRYEKHTICTDGIGARDCQTQVYGGTSIYKK